MEKKMSEETSSFQKNEVLKEKLKKRIFDWCMSVTSHGLPRIIEAEKLHIKLLWLFCLLVSVSLCAVMLTRSIQNYLAFEVTTTIRVKALKEIELPVITICNMNTFVKKEAKDFLNDFTNDPINFNISKYFDEKYQNVSIPPVDNNYEYWLSSMMSHPYFNESIKKSFSYWPDGFINCEARDEFVNCSDVLSWFYQPIWGNCFKFNSGVDYWGKKTNLKRVGCEGEGLAVEMFVNPSDLFVDYGYAYDSNGILISINHQDSNYFYPDFFSVKPGTTARVKISKVITESMPYPYGNCVPAEQMDNLFARELKKLGVNYSRKNCMVVCMQKLIIDQHGCYALVYPKILNAQPCTNLTDYSFPSLDECFDNCPYECSSIKYDVTISTSEYPSNSKVKRLMRSEKKNLMWVYNTDIITDDMIRDSYSKVFVYFDDIKETHITESEKVPFVDFIANLGGTLGLFIGVSLLSFVEIIELILNLIEIFIQSRRNR